MVFYLARERVRYQAENQYLIFPNLVAISHLNVEEAIFAVLPVLTEG